LCDGRGSTKGNKEAPGLSSIMEYDLDDGPGAMILKST
jgi:hypothetical protein